MKKFDIHFRTVDSPVILRTIRSRLVPRSGDIVRVDDKKYLVSFCDWCWSSVAPPGRPKRERPRFVGVVIAVLELDGDKT